MFTDRRPDDAPAHAPGSNLPSAPHRFTTTTGRLAPNLQLPGRGRFHLLDDGYDSSMRLLRINLLGLVYLIVGVLVAATHHYFRNLHSFRLIASAVLAIVLWPLVLLGVDVHIHP